MNGKPMLVTDLMKMPLPIWLAVFHNGEHTGIIESSPTIAFAYWAERQRKMDRAHERHRYSLAQVEWVDGRYETTAVYRLVGGVWHREDIALDDPARASRTPMRALL